MRLILPCPLRLLLALALLAGGGCARLRPSGSASDEGIRVSGVQYAVAAMPEAGDCTVEVYLENRGSRPVTFAGADLDGEALPDPRSADIERLAGHFSLQLHEGGLSLPLPPPVLDERVNWWQFYPSAVIPPGGTILFQVNLAGASDAPRRLDIRSSDGKVYPASLPRYTPPPVRLLAATWRDDYRRMYVQYTGTQAPLESLEIDGVRVPSLQPLPPARAGQPAAVAFDPPRPPRRGDTVAMTLRFADGAERRALVRAVSGIMLDAPRGWEQDKLLPAAVRAAYGLDDDPAIAYLPFDVTCGDTRAGRHGAAAMSVALARRRLLDSQPDRLSGVEYCTAIYRSIWNIYGPIADAVFIKPYQLHWGPDATRFIELEQDRMLLARASAAPRPFVWVPERYKRQRHIEGEELRVMGWSALALGAKGIRYHFWMNDPDAPFRECPDLGEGMKVLNAEVARLRPLLGPLVPV